MELRLDVRRSGKNPTPGTLAWLLENAGYVEIGTTKDGNQGAWLKAKDGNLITCLAIRNFGPGEPTGHPDGEITLVSKNFGEPMYQSPLTLYASRPFTCAALRLVIRLAELAAVEMEGDISSEDGTDLPVVVLARASDPVATAIARDARREPTLLPILLDRLTERE